jgi:hypothetical protein
MEMTQVLLAKAAVSMPLPSHKWGLPRNFMNNRMTVHRITDMNLHQAVP